MASLHYFPNTQLSPAIPGDEAETIDVLLRDYPHLAEEAEVMALEHGEDGVFAYVFEDPDYYR